MTTTKPVATALLAMCLFVASQGRKKTTSQEQAHFSCEQGDVDEPVLNPVSLPKGALDALSKNELVAGCLKREGISRERIPAAWFIASTIHLHDPQEIDFVVLPSLDLPPGTDGPSPGTCFLGANVGWFWIIRETAGSYDVALMVGGHDLEVSKNRTNGFRDIVATTLMRAGEYVGTVIYKFDGKAYRKSVATTSKASP